MSRSREVIAVLGQTGSGKTSWAKKFLADKTRVLILDADFREFSAYHLPDLSRTIDFLNDRSAENHEVPFRVSFTPLSDEQDDTFSFAYYLENLWLVLEEADRFDPRELPAYEEIIARGRHAGVNILAITRHPYALPKDLRREITRLVSFRLVDENDADWASWLVGREKADSLLHLPNYQPLDISLNT